MAFVCKSEKPTFLPSRSENPGPGYYAAPNSSKVSHGYAPFLSTAQKQPQPKKNAPKPPPGPGSYELPSSFQTIEKSNKVCYSTLSRHQQPLVEYANMTTIFKSKVKRFESLERDPTPGPGTYENIEAQKRRNSLTQTVPVHSNIIVDKIIEQSKKGVASIPSHMNRYGYSEDNGHNLVPNKNPLFELQKYVGPGYYQAPEYLGANRNKGIGWERSNTRRFDDAELKKATRDRVGPGSYELDIRSVHPSQNKPSSSFASKINRDSSAEKKSPNKKRSGSVPPRRGQTLFNDVGFNDQSYQLADQFREELDELVALQEMADIAPGPGHYHNDRANSSIRTSYKPPRLQFFGSSTERFPNREPVVTTVGPGEYHDRHKSAPPKKGKKNPGFATSVARFDKEVAVNMPGPGAYNPKQTILDRIRDKERLGYIGSFGMTDKRFKNKPVTVQTPDPGQYSKTEETPIERSEGTNSTKPNQSFQSKVTRDSLHVKKDKIPAPGTYDLGYYDLAKKALKDVNNETKPPFNTASTRFKRPKVEEQPTEEDEESARSPKNRSISCPARKSKMNAVFASQTRKNYDQIPANNQVPGPGQYARNMTGSWVKKTYNIGFMHE